MDREGGDSHRSGSSDGGQGDVELGLWSGFRQRPNRKRSWFGAAKRKKSANGYGAKVHPAKHKRKVTRDLAVDQTLSYFEGAFDAKTRTIENHVKAQTYIAACQLASVVAFFVGFTLFCFFFVVPELSTIATSAEVLANASVPLQASALHVQNIAEGLANVTEHVGDTFMNVTDGLGGALGGTASALHALTSNLGENAGGLVNSTIASIQEFTGRLVGNDNLISGNSSAGFGDAISGILCSTLTIGCPPSTETNLTSPGLTSGQSFNATGYVSAKGADSIVQQAAQSLGGLLLGEDDGEDGDAEAVVDTLARTGEVLVNSLSNMASNLWCNIADC